MRLKTSLFNWTLFKKDIFRVWPFWVLQLVIFQLMSTVQIFSGFLYYKQKMVLGLVTSYMPNMQMRMIAFVSGALYSLIIAVVCIISAVLVFSYLNKRVESYMIHSFPLTRQTLFVTHGLAGLSMAYGPLLITFIVMFIENAVMDTGMGEVLIQYMFQTAVMVIFFYAMACLVVMVSGHGFMSIVIYAVSNFLVYGIEKLFYLVRLFYSVDNVSYYSIIDFSVSDISMQCTPILAFLKLGYRTFDLPWSWMDSLARQFLVGSVNWNWDGSAVSFIADWRHFGLSCLYLIPAVIFIVLALLLYKKRPLEYIGNNLAFKWCKYVFLWVFSIFGSLILLTFLGVVGKQSFFAHLVYQQIMVVASVLVGVFSLIFYIIGDMLLSKDFHKWSRISWKWAIAFSVAIACLFAGMNFFYENSSVPDTNYVSYAKVSLGDNQYILKDSTLVEHLGQIQKEFINEVDNHTPEVGQEWSNHIQFDIEYVLDSHRHVKRSYSIMYEDYENTMKQLCELINQNIRSFEQVMKPLADIEPLRCSEITFNYYDNGEYMESYSAYQKEFRNELYQAMAADLKEGHLYLETLLFFYDNTHIIDKSKVLAQAFVSFNADNVKEDVMTMCTVWITDESKHTIEVMKKHDIYDYHDVYEKNKEENSSDLTDSGRWQSE